LQCVAVCCSVLQCVAVCCSVLQCVAVCCNMLQYVAVCCSTLQCVAVCCSVLQCVAICCSVLRYVANWLIYRCLCTRSLLFHRSLVTRSCLEAPVLQCDAVRCSVLQFVACIDVITTTLSQISFDTFMSPWPASWQHIPKIKNASEIPNKLVQDEVEYVWILGFLSNLSVSFKR